MPRKACTVKSKIVTNLIRPYNRNGRATAANINFKTKRIGKRISQGNAAGGRPSNYLRAEPLKPDKWRPQLNTNTPHKFDVRKQRIHIDITWSVFTAFIIQSAYL